MNGRLAGVQSTFRSIAMACAIAGLVSCTGELFDPDDDEVAILPGNTAMLVGDTAKLSLFSAQQGTITGAVDWTSSAPAVATVSSSGVVRGVSIGNAVIRGAPAQNSSKVAIVTAQVQRYAPLASTYAFTFRFDSTRFEVTAPNGGCPIASVFCTYTRPSGANSNTLSGTMKILDSTFNYTPTSPAGPARLVSIAEVLLNGRFCQFPDFAIPVGCIDYEDVPTSRHTALITRASAYPPSGSFVRIDSGLVSGDTPTERFLSLTYEANRDSIYGRFTWVLHRSARSPTTQLGSFVARRQR